MKSTLFFISCSQIKITKMRFIRPLQDAEIEALKNNVRKSTNFKFINRCQCILLSNKGIKVKELSQMYDVRTRTIYSWFDRFEKMGVIGLAFLIKTPKKAVLSIENDEHVNVVYEVLKKKHDT